MHKPALFIIITLINLALTAAAQKDVTAVINAEKSFAAYALAHNSRDAFMQFLDSAYGIEFNNGDAKKSYDIWSVKKPDPSKLIWQPAYAGIATGGDMGFTTGPWEYKPQAGAASVAAGQFATIWHLNQQGEWKYLLDIGVDGNLPAYTVSHIKTVTDTVTTIDATDAMAIDRKFILQYQSLHNDAYKAVVTGDSWFVLKGIDPIIGNQQILAGINQIPANIQFIPMGGGESGAGDMAYVYGTMRHEASITNYLRVWQKAKDGYKLLLQVLQ